MFAFMDLNGATTYWASKFIQEPSVDTLGMINMFAKWKNPKQVTSHKILQANGTAIATHFHAIVEVDIVFLRRRKLCYCLFPLTSRRLRLHPQSQIFPQFQEQFMNVVHCTHCSGLMIVCYFVVSSLLLLLRPSI